MSFSEQGGNEGAEPFGADAGIDPNEAIEETPVDVEASPEIEGEAVQEPVFDGTQYALKYRGQTIHPESHEQLLNWAQQGRSYSEKMNALNQRETELNTRSSRYDDLEKMANEFDSNPSFKAKILKLRDEAMSSEPSQEHSNPDVQALVDQKVKEAFEPYTAKIDEDKADQELDAEINTLKSKYVNEKWEEKDAAGKSFLWEVMNHAHLNNFPNLESAYRDYTYDNVRTNTEAETLKTQADLRVRDSKNGVVEQRGSNQMVQPKKVNIGRESYESLANQAAQEYAKNL